jgi:hypothetical protein
MINKLIKFIQRAWHKPQNRSSSIRKEVAREAYNRFIGSNKNLTPEKFREANPS